MHVFMRQQEAVVEGYRHRWLVFEESHVVGHVGDGEKSLDYRWLAILAGPWAADSTHNTGPNGIYGYTASDKAHWASTERSTDRIA
ncbi:hypothetical protein L249_4791 [Ophiocordyceps polyrhachis-furcata BCC 54312]|uniref:Uncharacterized protein n=1 Tax=Ophiocordyceps polyrhachis-furcata BCC 54312 TaxID=1330021 RepID=A0A367L2K2_9HYPO|nr:hypothetical protein L249_4791 [Ophiocordyceps polyrhachis-furcata BCC 54312]